MPQGKQRMFTGLQPSGALHIGNYFGALKPFVELSNEYESYLMIADYHALTTLKDASALHANILDVAPVGADQKQHVEYAREAAAKFNAAFPGRAGPGRAGGDTFKEPKECILEKIAT